MEKDEQELIAAAQKGDAEAFGVLVTKYMPRALAFARRMTGNTEDAEDLAQEAFVKAYRNLGSFKGQSGFYTWFFQVLSNLCMDHLRRAALLKKVFFFAAPDVDREEASDPLMQAPDTDLLSRPDGGLEQKELKAALQKALKRLPDRQRAVFLMKHNEDMKLREIAVVLGISEGAVKSHLVRAVTALKKSMKGYGHYG